MNDTRDKTSARPAPKTLAQMLGEVVWIMSQSPVHKQLAIGDLEWFCMPAMLLEQYRIFYGPEAPAAVALWANVSESVEQKILAGLRLRPDEWNSGERAWLIELVAPFGGEAEIFADLQANVFRGKAFKFHRLDAGGDRRVETYGSDA